MQIKSNIALVEDRLAKLYESYAIAALKDALEDQLPPIPEKKVSEFKEALRIRKMLSEHSKDFIKAHKRTPEWNYWFGDLIKDVRKRIPLTQAQLSRVVSTDKLMLVALESHHTSVFSLAYEELSKLLIAFQIKLSDFVHFVNYERLELQKLKNVSLQDSFEMLREQTVFSAPAATVHLSVNAKSSLALLSLLRKDLLRKGYDDLAKR